MHPNLYLLVGLVFGSAAGYIVRQTLPKKDEGFEIIAGGLVMIMWPILLGMAALGILVTVGLVIGKLLFKGGNALLPKLKEIWQLLD